MSYSNPRKPLSINRSKLSVPFRSQLCIQFQRGKCYYGENCHFAHSASDLIIKSGVHDTSVGAESENIVVVSGNTKECFYFKSKLNCPYGDSCQFLHRGDEGLNRENFAITVANGGSDRGGREEYRSLNVGEDGKNKAKFYKTRLCDKWERFGRCSRGANCTYAHGVTELKTVARHPALEHSIASKSTVLARGSSSEALIEIGTKSFKKLKVKDKRCFVNWSIDKVRQIYADWLDTEHDFDFSWS